MPTKITNIILLVKDRYTLTKQAIDSLRKHTDRNAYTLTLVDDGSADFRVIRYLRDEALASSENTTLVRVQHSTHQLSRLKNLGAIWSEQHFGKAEWIYFSDNDVYFQPDWLTILTDAATQSMSLGFKIWGGQSHPYHNVLSGFRVWGGQSQGVPVDGVNLTEHEVNLTEHNCLAGTSMLMLSQTWDITGGFDRCTAPGVCQSEDFDLTRRINGRIGVVSPHVVIHTGVTNSEGKPAVGSELFPRVPGIIYE
jgi:hypothetical protein